MKNFRHRYKPALAVVGALAFVMNAGFAAVPASAASIAKVERADCKIALSGPIASGDLDRLKAMETSGLSLCLDSPGGDFLEGLAIAEWLVGANVETVIQDGASCYSACAMVFIAGSQQDEELYRPKRTLHIGGRLGFQAPYLAARSKTYTTAQVETMNSDVVQSVARMMKLGADGLDFSVGSFIPQGVMAKILAAGPQKFYMIDDVIKARELHIDLVGVPKAKWTTAALCNACIVRNERRARNDACDKPTGTMMINKDVAQTTFFGFAGEGSYYCAVRLSNKTGKASIAATISEDEISKKDLAFSPLADEDALPVKLKED